MGTAGNARRFSGASCFLHVLLGPKSNCLEVFGVCFAVHTCVLLRDLGYTAFAILNSGNSCATSQGPWAAEGGGVSRLHAIRAPRFSFHCFHSRRFYLSSIADPYRRSAVGWPPQIPADAPMHVRVDKGSQKRKRQRRHRAAQTHAHVSLLIAPTETRWECGAGDPAYGSEPWQ